MPTRRPDRLSLSVRDLAFEHFLEGDPVVPVGPHGPRYEVTEVKPFELRLRVKSANGRSGRARYFLIAVTEGA